MPPKKFALLVGINYFNTPYELGGCINDVNAMKDFLINNQKFTTNNIIVLSDNQILQQKKPTRENIIRLLTIGINQMKSGDYFYFHYSGHGSQVRDQNNDESDKLDETIVPADFQKSGMITDDLLRSVVNNVPQGAKFVAVIDACHSATSFDLRYLYDPVTRRNLIRKNKARVFSGGRLVTYDKNLNVNNNIKETNGNIIVLSGCKDDQTSADVTINGKRGGALTLGLINVLQSKNNNCVYRDLPTLILDFILNNKLGDQIPRLTFGKDTPLVEKIF